MQATEINLGGVIAQCVGVITSRIGLTLGTIFLITAGFSLLDLVPNKGASTLPSLIVNLVVQYYFVEALLLEGVERSQRRKRRYGSLFLAGLLGSLGIFAGMILLLLPGIFLMARWSISTPFIVADGMNGSEALKASWNATFGSRWTLFVLFLLSCIALGALFLVVILITTVLHLDPDSPFLSVASNFLVSLWLVGGWILGVGIYRCLRPSSIALESVFA